MKIKNKPLYLAGPRATNHTSKYSLHFFCFCFGRGASQAPADGTNDAFSLACNFSMRIQS
jgi:hypothetical protein